MAVSLIYLIVITAILVRVAKRRKARQARTVRNNPSAGKQGSTGTKNRTDSLQAYRSQPPTYYQQQQQMRDLKNRLEKKYKNTPRPMTEKQKSTYSQNMNQKKPKRENSILESAKENVAENNVDVMKEADRKWHETGKTPLAKAGEETDVLKQVYDLMAVGYSGNLHFERDFLSEGIDMINRMSIKSSALREMLTQDYQPPD